MKWIGHIEKMSNKHAANSTWQKEGQGRGGEIMWSLILKKLRYEIGRKLKGIVKNIRQS